MTWGELSPLGDPALVGHRRRPGGRELGRPASGQPLSPLLDRLASMQSLPVLDNAEHVIDVVANLADALVSRNHTVRLLVTSREPLHIRGESVLRLEPLKRSYIPQSMDEQLVLLWGKRLTDLARTSGHNLTCSPATAARFERAAVSDHVEASALPDFRRFLEQEGQAFLERVDAWLTDHQARNGEPDKTRAPIRLGAGLYHIGD